MTADREAYLKSIIDKVENDLVHNKMGSVFRGIKQLAGTNGKPFSTIIHKADGSPCDSETEIIERWREHFVTALNHSTGTPSLELDAEAENATADLSTSVDEPSLEEVTAAICKLKNGRAPGPDGIPAELLKFAVIPVARALHSIFLSVWRTGRIPGDWKDGIIVTLYKGKGPKTDCSSYRPITLLSVPGKVFAHVLLARIQPLLDKVRRPHQSGFTAGRSTIDAILALRLLSELHREFNRPLNVAYLDIKAAFDSVDRRALWKALRSTGVPDILIDLIAALHENTGTQVRSGKNLSNRFHTSSGVRQGCILAPALFSIAIDWIINHMSTKPGINVGAYRFTDLVYADDTTFFVSSPLDAIECLSCFNSSSSVLGLRVSWAKTKLQNIGSGSHPPDITVDGNTVEQVDNFTYLGSIQSSNGGSQVDIKRRIALASSVMSSLQQVWRDRYLSLATKIRVYQTLVLPVLLYACETWTILAADTKRLEAFHMKCQRQIMKIRWQDHVRNSEVSALTGLDPVSDLISRRRNSVFGHVARLSEDTPAHQALRCHIDLSLGHLPEQGWRRRPGRPSNRWIDQIRRDNNNIPPADLWRRSIKRGHSGVTLRSSLTMR